MDDRDTGKNSETEVMVGRDMAEYLTKKNLDVEKNIALMKQWAQARKMRS